jgi:hypothetical protein
MYMNSNAYQFIHICMYLYIHKYLYLRKHQNTLVALVCKFLDSHLQPCLDIIESMCIVLQVQDFNNVLRDVIPTLMQLIKEEPISGYFIIGHFCYICSFIFFLCLFSFSYALLAGLRFTLAEDRFFNTLRL